MRRRASLIRSRSTLAVTLGLAVSVIIGACDSAPTELTRLPASLKLREEDPLLDTEADTAVVRPTQGGINVLGRITTPNPCYELEPDVAGGDEKILLRVVAVPADGVEACAAVLGSLAYEVDIPDLRPGEYLVTVVHSYPGTGWPDRTVADETVQVP